MCDTVNTEDVETMIRIKCALDSCSLSQDTTRNDDPTDPKNFRRYLRSVAFRKILKEVNGYLFLHCKHDFVDDLIDIDPDRSQTIRYCYKCMLTCQSP
jgi:hypothetical protein